MQITKDASGRVRLQVEPKTSTSQINQYDTLQSEIDNEGIDVDKVKSQKLIDLLKKRSETRKQTATWVLRLWVEPWYENRKTAFVDSLAVSSVKQAQSAWKNVNYDSIKNKLLEKWWADKVINNLKTQLKSRWETEKVDMIDNYLKYGSLQEWQFLWQMADYMLWIEPSQEAEAEPEEKKKLSWAKNVVGSFFSDPAKKLAWLEEITWLADLENKAIMKQYEPLLNASTTDYNEWLEDVWGKGMFETYVSIKRSNKPSQLTRLYMDYTTAVNKDWYTWTVEQYAQDRYNKALQYTSKSAQDQYLQWVEWSPLEYDPEGKWTWLGWFLAEIWEYWVLDQATAWLAKKIFWGTKILEWEKALENMSKWGRRWTKALNTLTDAVDIWSKLTLMQSLDSWDASNLWTKFIVNSVIGKLWNEFLWLIFNKSWLWKKITNWITSPWGDIERALAKISKWEFDEFLKYWEEWLDKVMAKIGDEVGLVGDNLARWLERIWKALWERRQALIGKTDYNLWKAIRKINQFLDDWTLVSEWAFSEWLVPKIKWDSKTWRFDISNREALWNAGNKNELSVAEKFIDTLNTFVSKYVKSSWEWWSIVWKWDIFQTDALLNALERTSWEAAGAWKISWTDRWINKVYKSVKAIRDDMYWKLSQAERTALEEANDEFATLAWWADMFEKYIAPIKPKWKTEAYKREQGQLQAKWWAEAQKEWWLVRSLFKQLKEKAKVTDWKDVDARIIAMLYAYWLKNPDVTSKIIKEIYPSFPWIIEMFMWLSRRKLLQSTAPNYLKDASMSVWNKIWESLNKWWSEAITSEVSEFLYPRMQ